MALVNAARTSASGVDNLMIFCNFCCSCWLVWMGVIFTGVVTTPNWDYFMNCGEMMAWDQRYPPG